LGNVGNRATILARLFTFVQLHRKPQILRKIMFSIKNVGICRYYPQFPLASVITITIQGPTFKLCAETYKRLHKICRYYCLISMTTEKYGQILLKKTPSIEFHTNLFINYRGVTLGFTDIAKLTGAVFKLFIVNTT
jgi:hypothetical protein